mgnify:CR=1 FL=1
MKCNQWFLCRDKLPKEPSDSLNFNTWIKYLVKLNTGEEKILKYAGNSQWCDDEWDFYTVTEWKEVS